MAVSALASWRRSSRARGEERRVPPIVLVLFESASIEVVGASRVAQHGEEAQSRDSFRETVDEGWQEPDGVSVHPQRVEVLEWGEPRLVSELVSIQHQCLKRLQPTQKPHLPDVPPRIPPRVWWETHTAHKARGGVGWGGGNEERRGSVNVRKLLERSSSLRRVLAFLGSAVAGTSCRSR